MNPQKEFEHYVSVLEATPLGQEILVSLEKAGELFLKYILEERKGEGSQSIQPELVKTICSFLGQKKVAQLFVENATLFCGRFMEAAKTFDEKSLDEKVEIVLDLLEGMLHELIVASDRAKLLQDAPHDKRARKQRRQDLLSEDQVFCEKLNGAEDALIDRCIQILLPKGSRSLLLPAGAGLFSGKIDEVLKGLGPFAKGFLKGRLTKERKVDLLCRGYVYIYVWGCKGCPLGSCSSVEIPSALLEKITPNLERAVMELFPIAASYARYIPKDVVARKIALFLYGVLEHFSLENSFLRLLHHLLDRKGVVYTSRTNEELDTVIAKLCSDEKIPTALLDRFMLAKSEEEKPEPKDQSLLGNILHGLRSSMTQKTSKVVLQSLPWKEVFYHFLEEIRFFALSVHFDKAVVEGLNKAMDR